MPDHAPVAIVRLPESPWVSLRRDARSALDGIRGRAGVFAVDDLYRQEIGLDEIEMQPGAAFPLHTHPGSHILAVQSGEIGVEIDGTVYRLRQGDTIYIPAEYPHGVLMLPEARGPATFYAFGYPHKRIEAADRMTIVEPAHSERVYGAPAA